MLDLSLYNATAELPLAGLSGSDRVSITTNMQDVRGCKAIFWDTATHAWSDAGVECQVPGTSVGQSPIAGPATLYSSHLTGFAAVQGGFSCPGD
jgi:hypothetical protein